MPGHICIDVAYLEIKLKLVNDLNLGIKFRIFRGKLMIGLGITDWSRCISFLGGRPILTKKIPRQKISKNRG